MKTKPEKYFALLTREQANEVLPVKISDYDRVYVGMPGAGGKPGFMENKDYDRLYWIDKGYIEVTSEEFMKYYFGEGNPEFKIGDECKCKTSSLTGFTKNKIYEVQDCIPPWLEFKNDDNTYVMIARPHYYFKKIEQPQKFMCVADAEMLNEYLSPVYDDTRILFSNPKRFTQTHLNALNGYLSQDAYKLITTKEFKEKFPPPNKKVEWKGLKVERNADGNISVGFICDMNLRQWEAVFSSLLAYFSDGIDVLTKSDVEDLKNKIRNTNKQLKL